MNHIVVIGFMGCGKTRVGKRLAKDLKLGFVDVDKEITKRMKLSTAEIFGRFGEPYYRAMETLTVKELLKREDRCVVCLGAGLPVQEQNEPYIKKLGTVLFIYGSQKVLLSRLREMNDPSLEKEGGEEKVVRLLHARNPVYERSADIRVETGVKSFEDLIAEIEEKLSAFAGRES